MSTGQKFGSQEIRKGQLRWPKISLKLWTPQSLKQVWLFEVSSWQEKWDIFRATFCAGHATWWWWELLDNLSLSETACCVSDIYIRCMKYFYISFYEYIFTRVLHLYLRWEWLTSVYIWGMASTVTVLKTKGMYFMFSWISVIFLNVILLLIHWEICWFLFRQQWMDCWASYTARQAL